ncbi:hypothetical protein A2U01_0064607, partial [Trifolium medium]|nr:hypothetical protein [Trifolium medium]
MPITLIPPDIWHPAWTPTPPVGPPYRRRRSKRPAGIAPAADTRSRPASLSH